MKNFFTRLSASKWLFAFLIYVVAFSAFMFGHYYDEIEAIRQKSLEHFGGDITAHLGFFEVLKSNHFDFWDEISGIFYRVFIPYLLIAAYFYDYKKETHAGWQRIYLSAQILFPSVIFVMYMLNGQGLYDFYHLIKYSGFAETVALVIIQFIIWVRKGFVAQTD